jgi:SAM-dependent methyltransferase
MQQAEIQWEHTPCPACGQEKAQPFHTGEDRLYGVKGEFRLVQCEVCRLIYLNPRPALSSIGLLYTDRYSQHQSFDGKQNRPRRFIGTIVQKKRIKSIERIRRLERDDRLLDVGCGTGLFLSVVRDHRNVHTTGVELDNGIAARCRMQQELDVRGGTLLEQQFPNGAFDMVTMFQYFEHEGQPLLVLRETRRILKPDGLLVIEVPNAGGVLARLFKANWMGMEFPRHLVNYTPETLAAMLRRGGFEVIETSFQPVEFLLLSLLIRLGVPNKLRFLSLRTTMIMLAAVWLPLLPLEIAVGWLLGRLRRSDIFCLFSKPTAPSRLPQRRNSGSEP